MTRFAWVVLFLTAFTGAASAQGTIGGSCGSSFTPCVVTTPVPTSFAPDIATVPTANTVFTLFATNQCATPVGCDVMVAATANDGVTPQSGSLCISLDGTTPALIPDKHTWCQPPLWLFTVKQQSNAVLAISSVAGLVYTANRHQ